MELDTEKIYVVLDIHPNDFYYDYRDDLIGHTICVDYGRTSRIDGGDYFYCDGYFVQPVLTSNVYIQRIVFHAVMLGELDDVINERTSPKTQASEGPRRKRKAAIPTQD